ncbi:MAG: pantoate--beta-alanine ligase [Acidimicrobiales bacterium]
MHRVVDIEQWRRLAEHQRAAARRVGLVPTMGALHRGHQSLVEAARANGDYVIMTIFVNPRQFNDPNDLRAYPRTPETDRDLAESIGVDALVEPTMAEMWPAYPDPTPTTVSVAGLGDVLEGDGRPGHFDGVASVVAKLAIVTGPSRIYFGEKDFQQLAVVRRMVLDLGLDVEVVGCPIVRDDDGLALSSRNVRLDVHARTRALALNRALTLASELDGPASAMRAVMRATMEAADVVVGYAEVVDPATLQPLDDGATGRARALVAGVVDGVRLIDNRAVELRRGR